MKLIKVLFIDFVVMCVIKDIDITFIRTQK